VVGLPTHDTPLRRAPIVPAGVGTGTTVHRTPFQISEKTRWSPTELMELPTATQEDIVVHDKPSSAGLTPLVGLGTGVADQCVPFHFSPYRRLPPAPSTPMARQNVPDGRHDTEPREAPSEG
jgi:hypothetical protein